MNERQIVIYGDPRLKDRKIQFPKLAACDVELRVTRRDYSCFLGFTIVNTHPFTFRA